METQIGTLKQTVMTYTADIPAPIQVSGKDIYVMKTDYQAFWRALIHVFRNIADHGIEKARERLQAGKPEQGLIRFWSRTVSGNCALSFRTTAGESMWKRSGSGRWKQTALTKNKPGRCGKKIWKIWFLSRAFPCKKMLPCCPAEASA